MDTFSAFSSIDYQSIRAKTPAETAIKRLSGIGEVLSGLDIDTIHSPGSTSELRSNTNERSNCLHSFEFQNGMLVGGGVAFAEGEEGGEGEVGTVGRLGNLLYGPENLRKREGDGGEQRRAIVKRG